MSLAIIVGFFFFWAGITLSPIALCIAIGERTLNNALLWFASGVSFGVFMMLSAMSLNYSPPWSGMVSTIIAYTLLACVIAVAGIILLKPVEQKQ